jgi:hypothetical protein
MGIMQLQIIGRTSVYTQAIRAHLEQARDECATYSSAL